jgi:uncharacterized protein
VLNLSHIRDLTIEFGDGWAYPHVCRVLQLIEEIGAGLNYDKEVTTYAAYLHDLGALPHYHLQGVKHTLRSIQVAEKEILPYTNLSKPTRQAVLDSIAQHDYCERWSGGTIEAQLLREADMLEMIGVIGVLREFAWGPNNLKISYERVLSRRNGIIGQFNLPRAQIIAEERIASMDQLLERFHQESNDLF